MKGLLKYDPKYRITEEWVREFREWLKREITIIQQSPDHILFSHCETMFQLTNNGLEFNLSVVNLYDIPSIPYVKNKKAVDPEDLALKIIGIIKEQHKGLKKARKGMKLLDAFMAEGLKKEDADYLDKFLRHTRNKYDN